MTGIALFKRVFCQADILFSPFTVVHRGLVHNRFGMAVTFQWTLILSSAVATATSVHFHTFCQNLFVMRLDYIIHIGHTAVADLHLVSVENLV